MGTISPASPDRMYPWWWDSHINPKNSKWLHENVTDMDAKVKQMIKLIEEDADSFARRAEMYYKKRPELMKLVEEFYRAYRALAGRYDHVAGVLRQAHRTVAEVFPNQVPFALVDELPAGLGGEAYPGSLRMPQIFLPFDLGELGKDASQISNDLTGSGEGPKLAKSSERRARKSLNFRDAETIRNGEEKSAVDNPEVQVPSESERMGKAELEILTLKTVLSSLEAEKQAGLLQYQQSLERLSNLEVEVSRAKEDSNGLNERASKAEAEVNTLKESLEKLDAERHASFLQYQLCVEKISNFENYISRAENDAGQLNERASKAETEAQTLSHDLTKLEDEKESSLDLYNQCLEKISDMEGKLLQAKEAARRSNDRADTADKEVEALMQALAMLVDEKEGAAVKYNNCLETVALLEHRLKVAEEDAKRLNSKIDDGVAKFKSAEERCLQLERSNQMLHSDMETSAQKMAAQNEELIEKQKELSRIWTCLQEERLRYVETQNAFQSLERSNSQSQEELSSLTVEIRKREGTIEELKAANKSLLAEVEQIKVENKGLNEVNLSLALTVKDLKAEVSCSRETIRKLEAEVELRVNQRNALQQEVYGMTEDLKPLNMKHQAFSAQVESLGICSNAILEDSLSDTNMELDVVRDKVKALEESSKLLRDENSALISNKAILASQLHKVSDNLDKLSEEKSYLENSLNAAYSELEEWREKSRCVEESCHLLEKRNCSIDGESDQLRDKVVTLDVQNKELKSQIAEYAKAIKYLRDFVTTLESRVVVDASHQGDNKEAKEARRDMALAVCGDIHLEMVEESRSMLLGEYADLNDLQRRTRTVEKLITEREKQLLLENSATKSKLEAAMKQLEDLKSKRNLRRLHTTKARHINGRLENDDLKPQATHEISEEGSEIMTKDIMLDGSSECSSIGFSRTSTVETNDPLEFWEAAFHEGSIDLTVEKAPKMQRTRSEKKQQRDQHQRRRTQSFVDKEVSVDNLEVPRRIPAPCHDANERKVLERLDSDAQKLTNLHITVQDLKKTVEVTEKMRRGTTTTGIEYGNVKEQLEESEEAVIKLFNLNLRLKRNFEDESFPLEETSALAFEEKKSIRRRKVTEQARRMSDKIGRLQLEVQKLQFLLMKLEDESKPRQKIKITERKTRVLLRDYLYTSGTRATRQRPKRGNLCACAQPSTKGD